jgi:ABC-2 type transport system ATP-binding protein
MVIQTRGLTRYFGRTCAVDQVTLGIPRGSVFALLGRNGSGKSTLTRMLLGLLDPTRGSATVLGEDSQHLSPATHGRIGYVAEGHPLIGWMRVRNLADFQRSFYCRWDGKLFKTVIDRFSLSDRARAASLSRGQRAGLSLALVLATRPELLVMDDPSMGLDPVARRTLLEAMILVTRDAGHTIFFSSHVLDDVERVADHVAILDRSILRVSASVEEFRRRIKRLVLNFAGPGPSTANIPGLVEARREGQALRLTLANPDAEAERAIAELGAVSIEEQSISLEEAVIAYLGDRGEHQSLLQQSNASHHQQGNSGERDLGAAHVAGVVRGAGLCRACRRALGPVAGRQRDGHG